MSMKNYEFWFVVGSQFLYGDEVLETVAKRAEEMAEKMNASGVLPCKVVYKVTAKTPEEITRGVKEASGVLMNIGLPPSSILVTLSPER